MPAAELAICHVPEDPASPIPAGGYVLACTMFYKQGFNVLSHLFLRSLLQFYDLKLIWGLSPHFNQWNYFFRARLRQSSDVKAMVLDSVVIYVRFRPEVDPYFLILMTDPLVGWRRAWFLLRDDADASLPAFTGSHPIPHPI
jgi:hypothetical protein